MNADAVAAKFIHCAALAVPSEQAARIRDAVLALEDIRAAELLALLRRDA